MEENDVVAHLQSSSTTDSIMSYLPVEIICLYIIRNVTHSCTLRSILACVMEYVVPHIFPETSAAPRDMRKAYIAGAVAHQILDLNVKISALYMDERVNESTCSSWCLNYVERYYACVSKYSLRALTRIHCTDGDEDRYATDRLMTRYTHLRALYNPTTPLLALHVSFAPHAIITIEFLRALPRTIVDLRLERCIFSNTYDVGSAITPLACTLLEFLCTQPFALHTLCVPNDRSHFWNTAISANAMPPTLTHLDVRQAFIPVNRLAQLPVSIKCVRANIVDADTANAAFQSTYSLPNTLHTFSMGALSEFANNELLQFPVTLTSLTLSHYNRFKILEILALPRQLKHLSITVNLSTCDRLGAVFPATLESLDLLGTGDLCDDNIAFIPRSVRTFVFEYSSHITDRGLAMLPPQLTHLKLGYADNITDLGIAKLPRTLLYLEMSNARCLSNAAFAALPPHIHTVKFAQSHNFTAEIYALIPKSVERLVVGTCYWTTWDQACKTRLNHVLITN